MSDIHNDVMESLRRRNNVIPFDFKRLCRSKENLKALERFNEEKATETAWQTGQQLQNPHLTVSGGKVGKAFYDYVDPMSSLRQDLEIIAMDFVERIMDAMEKHDDKR